MLESLQRETFEPLLKDRFEVEFGGPSVTVELTDVRGLTPPSDDHEGRAPWSVVFRAPPEALYEQGVYRLRHDSIGELDLFLVPIGPDREGMQYEAVFS